MKQLLDVLRKLMRRLVAVACVLGGGALTIYSGVGLLNLDLLAIGRMAPDGRDTRTVIVLILVGLTATLYGMASFMTEED